MEVEALGKHPGETTALKVDLQERQQFTAHLSDLIIMMYMYLSIFAAYTCCCQSKLLDCSASLKWRYPLCLQLNFYSISSILYSHSALCILHPSPYPFYYIYTIHSVLHVSDQKLKNELLNRQTSKTYFNLLFRNFFEK